MQNSYLAGKSRTSFYEENTAFIFNNNMCDGWVGGGFANDVG